MKLSVPRPALQPVSVTSPKPPEAGPSRLGLVMAIVGAGLLVQGIGDALARTGHRSGVLALVLLGIVAIFAPCAWRLAGSGASRDERIGVALVLGLGLLVSYFLRSPLLLDGFDELGHGATLIRLLDTRSLAITNTGLPISPYYPGLELLTLSVRWLTGFPLLLDQMVVLVAARIVLVLCVFLVVERVTRSARAGGIGVLVYAANPEFYSFDAQYAYETLALAFAAAVVYLVMSATDTPRPRPTRAVALALAVLGALVLTHHLTSWLTVAFLAVGAVGLKLATRRRTSTTEAEAGEEAEEVAEEQSEEQSEETDQRRTAEGPPVDAPSPRRYSADVFRVRIVGLVALAGLAVVVVRTAIVGSHLTGYVDPIFASAADDIGAALGHLHGNRQLFHSASGGGSPDWEIALMLMAAVAWCAIIAVSLYAVARRRIVRGGPLRFVPAAIAAAYPLVLLSSVSATSKEVGGRTMTFIFFGTAVVVGAWLATGLAAARRPLVQAGVVVVACMCFLGSTLFGGGPLASYVPGPYLVGADERSVSAPSIAVARWAAANLPPDTHVAADRDNGELLDALASVDPVTAIGGLDNTSAIFFDKEFNPYDRFLIRQADIRYIVIDTRLVRGLPLYGTYIADGEAKGPLTSAELGKIASVPGVRRVYDNGAIQVYDLSSVLGRPSLTTPSRSNGVADATGWDLAALCLAAAAAAVWGIRAWRRRHALPTLHRALCGLVAAMVGGLLGTGLVLQLHLPPRLVSVVTLVVVLGLGLRRAPRHDDHPEGASTPRADRPGAVPPEPPGTPDRDEPAGWFLRGLRRLGRSQVTLACVGLVLLGIGISLATTTARREWVAPPELSLVGRPGGHEVAGVQLGPAGAERARLEARAGNRVVWSTRVAPGTGPQTIPVPRRAVRPGTRLVLLVGGHPLRTVGG